MLHLQPITGRNARLKLSSQRNSTKPRLGRAGKLESLQTSAHQEEEDEPQLPLHVAQRLQALEQQVEGAYEAGFRAGYSAGAKVQVNVDLDLSSRRLHRTGSSSSSVTGSSNDSSNGQQTAQPPLASEASEAAATASTTTSSSSNSSQAAPDSIGRSVAKGLIWRLFSTTATVSIALLVLHDVIRVEDALAIGGLEFAAKFVLYFLHERLWASVTWL